MWAAHEGAPLVLRDSAPGLPKKGPPWDIEGEPRGPKIFALKRPFEANNESDAVGHTGHHKKIPGPTKIPSVQAPPQISNHYSPRVRTHHHDAALKPPAIFILRPIERACNWRKTMRQCVATSTWQHVTPPSHVCHSQHRTVHTGQTAPSPSNKFGAPPICIEDAFHPSPLTVCKMRGSVKHSAFACTFVFVLFTQIPFSV